jgi:Fe2+ transport system protein B
MDDPASAARADELERALGSPVVRISAATGAGLPEMFAALAPHVGPPVEE